MKVRNQRKEVVYTGDLTLSVPERKNAVAAIEATIKKAKTKEINLTVEQIQVLEDLLKCIVALRPVDPK